MSSPTYNLSPTYNASPSYDFSHSFNSFPAYNIVKRNFKSQAHNMGYVVPTRNASILGYGGRRTDGQFSERRKPSATQLPNAAIRAEARAIPNGDGENLTDRQRMILCYLNGEERHQRASKVYNSRGEFYSKYKYLTTMDDAFLATCDIPRIYVPRALGDRPDSRNLKQVKLEEEYMAKLLGNASPGYDRDEPGSEFDEDGNPRLKFSLPTFTTPLMPQLPFLSRNATENARRRTSVPAMLQLGASMIPELIENEAFQYLPKEAQTTMFHYPLTISSKATYAELCAAIMDATALNSIESRVPNAPDLYVGRIKARWHNRFTGHKACIAATFAGLQSFNSFERLLTLPKKVRDVYEYNWTSEILPFITSYPMKEIAFGFGVAVAEAEDEDEDMDMDTSYENIDPALLSL